MRASWRLLHRGGAHDRGATLIYAMLFTTISSVAVAAVISLATTHLRTTVQFRDQAAAAAAADGAGQIAINTLRNSTYIGTGNCLGPGHRMNLDNFYQVPTTGGQGSAVLTCDHVQQLSTTSDGRRHTFVYIEVYICETSTCSTGSGHLMLRFKFAIVDPSLTPVTGQRQIEVYGWSVQR